MYYGGRYFPLPLNMMITYINDVFIYCRMRRIKSSFNDPFSLGCICLYLASAINGYILRVDQSNDLEETKAFDDGRVPHKRTFGGIEEGFEEDVDGGAAGGDVGHSDGGSGRYVSFAEAPPKFIEARKHGKVLLECAAKGEPAPQIKWYKDGKPLHKVINTKIKSKIFSENFLFFAKEFEIFHYGRSGLKMRNTQQRIFSISEQKASKENVPPPWNASLRVRKKYAPQRPQDVRISRSNQSPGQLGLSYRRRCRRL